MKTLTCSLVLIGAVVAVGRVAPAQFQQPAEQRLQGAAPAGADQFGWAVALDAGVLAVGAPGADSGAVAVYGWSGAAWQFDSLLHGVGLDDSARFGAAVALQRDRLVVGAPNEHLGTSFPRGKAFVFERSAGVWTLAAQLAVPASHAALSFGAAVAIDGDRLVVGAPSGSVSLFSSGDAYVYERVAGAWTLAATLSPSDAWHGFEFGASVGVHGDEVVVGAPSRKLPGASAAEGAVYAFSLGASGWQEDQILVDSLTPSAGRLTQLGRSIAFDGQTVLSGSGSLPLEWLGVRGALVFERSLGAWSARQRLNSSIAGEFGSAVAVDGDALVVGARNSSSSSAGGPTGVATLWRREPSGWSERERLLDAPPVAYAHFGAAVALSGGRIAIGSPDAPFGGDGSAGAVSAFTLSSTFGELLCFGDGSGTACPCGANAWVSHGPGCESSRGWGALLVGGGSPSLSADDLVLTAAQLVPGKTAMLAYRATSANGGLGVPLHDGLLCIAGAGGRLGVRTAVSYPWTATWGPNLASRVGAVVGGSTYFQVWYRDPLSPCGGASNLTNAFKVTFAP